MHTGHMTTPNELGDFLRARRAGVRPGEVGLPSGTGPRRTPGLRREELAALAGLSIDYYIRLEQGKETNPSGPILAGLAQALRLNDEERAHLYTLANHVAARGAGQPRRPARDPAAPGDRPPVPGVPADADQRPAGREPGSAGALPRHHRLAAGAAEHDQVHLLPPGGAEVVRGLGAGGGVHRGAPARAGGDRARRPGRGGADRLAARRQPRVRPALATARGAAPARLGETVQPPAGRLVHPDV